MEPHPIVEGSDLPELAEVEYRVYYWEQPRPGFAWNLDAWSLTDCHDVLAALRWVYAHSRGRRFQLFAVIDEDTELRRSVLLLGDNPNSHPDDIPEWVLVQT